MSTFSNPCQLGTGQARAISLTVDAADGPQNIQINLPPNSRLLEYRLDTLALWDGISPSLELFNNAAGVPGLSLYNHGLMDSIGHRIKTVNPETTQIGSDGIMYCVITLGGATKGRSLFQVAFEPQPDWLLDGPQPSM